MTKVDVLHSWIKQHSVWIALFVLIVSIYSMGWVSAALFIRHDYAKTLERIDKAYTQSMADKDRLIKRLAESSAKAADAAKKAVKEGPRNE